LIKQVNNAIEVLTKNKIGAIITIINKDKIDKYRTDGLEVNANISAQLIISVFQKKSPLHDGALIIDNNKIAYVGTFYKITSRSIDNKYGARHRAAL
jgi:DNA integrity scanning protein DisA with diadenylate cyclase activity